MSTPSTWEKPNLPSATSPFPLPQNNSTTAWFLSQDIAPMLLRRRMNFLISCLDVSKRLYAASHAVASGTDAEDVVTRVVSVPMPLRRLQLGHKMKGPSKPEVENLGVQS
jgi:hypothetical protein